MRSVKHQFAVTSYSVADSSYPARGTSSKLPSKTEKKHLVTCSRLTAKGVRGTRLHEPNTLRIYTTCT